MSHHPEQSEADKVEAAQHAAEHGSGPSAGAAPGPSESGKPAPPAYEAGATTAEPTGQYMPPSGPPPTEAAAVPAGEHPHPQQQQQPIMVEQPGAHPMLAGHPGMQQQQQPGMQPGMHPGMQPGMHPGMQPILIEQRGPGGAAGPGAGGAAGAGCSWAASSEAVDQHRFASLVRISRPPPYTVPGSNIFELDSCNKFHLL
ncbi:hypothetical protein JCM8202_005821 [Rhodotorula sphaerocarpa]